MFSSKATRFCPAVPGFFTKPGADCQVPCGGSSWAHLAVCVCVCFCLDSLKDFFPGLVFDHKVSQDMSKSFKQLAKIEPT